MKRDDWGDDLGDLDFGLGPDKKEAELKGGGEKARAQISETLRRFRDRAKAEKKKFWDNVDSEYWFAVCFQSREQKEEFLRLAKIEGLGDKYLDGLEVAKKMGIRISHLTPPIHKRRIDQSWAGFVSSPKKENKE